MPELRKDPVIGRWVIISTKRAKRPDQFKPQAITKERKKCPFCPGNEEMTPEATFILPKGNDAQDWAIRTFASNMPFLTEQGDLNRRGNGIYDLMNGIGLHEVLVETPEHIANMADLSVEQLNLVFKAYCEKFLKVKEDNSFRYLLFYKNYGSDAGGGDINHSKSQLIATPVVPKRVKEELAGAQTYYKIHERCVFCDLIRQEIQDRVRVISENDDFLAISPFASRFPFEVWVLPKKHCCDFYSQEPKELNQFADMIKDVLMRMKGVLGNFAYNYVLHVAPFRKEEESKFKTIEHDYHWHLEITPRLTKVAGFEWGTGFYICPLPPEKATEYLKGAA